MIIYLIHFDRPLAHANHYIGKAHQLKRRLAYHKSGNGARILQVCNERGITYNIVRTWKVKDIDASTFERRLKNRKKPSEFCPICNPDGWLKNEVKFSIKNKL